MRETENQYTNPSVNNQERRKEKGDRKDVCMYTYSVSCPSWRCGPWVASRLQAGQPETDHNVQNGQRGCECAVGPEDRLADKALKGISRGSLGDLGPIEFE